MHRSELCVVALCLVCLSCFPFLSLLPCCLCSFRALHFDSSKKTGERTGGASQPAARRCSVLCALCFPFLSLRLLSFALLSFPFFSLLSFVACFGSPLLVLRREEGDSRTAGARSKAAPFDCRSYEPKTIYFSLNLSVS